MVLAGFVWAFADNEHPCAYSWAMTTSDTQQVKSLARGLRILDALAAQPHGLSLTDLSRAIDLAPSTVHRLLQTLQSMRYVRESVEGTCK